MLNSCIRLWPQACIQLYDPQKVFLGSYEYLTSSLLYKLSLFFGQCMHILPFSADTSQSLLRSVGTNTVDLLRPMQRLSSDSEFIDINLLYFINVFIL